METFLQISRAQSDSDKICVSLIRDKEAYIRVEMTLDKFADAITSGSKITVDILRWRILKLQTK